MSLTKEEKEIIVQILKLHKKEVQDTEKIPSSQVQFLAGERKYEEVLSNIIKKLED